MGNRYGKCSNCSEPLRPVWFTETEYKVIDGRRYVTGRKRSACSHLICPMCMSNECVDDSFDGPWE